MRHFIDIILPIPLPKAFTYEITKAEADFIKPGMRIAVPFGKQHIYTGLAQAVHTQPPVAYDPKSIHQILDNTPLVTAKQLDHWQWISEYYMCSLGEVVRAALPNAFLLESETVILKRDNIDTSQIKLSDDEYLIYEALQHQSSLKIKDVSDILDRKRVIPILNELVEKQVVNLQETLYEKYQPKQQRYLKLAEDLSSENHLKAVLEELSRAPKQRETLMSMFSLSSTTKKPIKSTDITNLPNASTSALKALIDKGYLSEYYVTESRVSYEGDASVEVKNLSTDQENALTKINQEFQEKSVVLLHGVTSSGKTEIYVKLIKEQLEKRNQVLYLLPEIALTTQLVQRLQAYFGNQLAVFHSRYSNNERVEVYNNILNNRDTAQVVIGARSALLLPFRSLGLVIVDEEHEPSYKQFDPAPRYHARDAAIVLAKLFKAKTVLGSATPSLESYFNATQDKYGLVELNQR
ncbi:MAG: DEAD/DEAH box helicase, partial [Winogradskyella sp.]|nr:DEAD/DEAH box helicase [Winogradskyella sp.]